MTDLSVIFCFICMIKYTENRLCTIYQSKYASFEVNIDHAEKKAQRRPFY